MCDPLDGLETPLELGICLVQREGGVRAGLPADVYHGEEQVAEFRFELFVAGVATRHAVRLEDRTVCRDHLFDFRQLLADLVDRATHVRPVEADTGGAFLQPMCAVQRRESCREPVRE